MFGVFGTRLRGRAVLCAPSAMHATLAAPVAMLSLAGILPRVLAAGRLR